MNNPCTSLDQFVTKGQGVEYGDIRRELNSYGIFINIGEVIKGEGEGVESGGGGLGGLGGTGISL